MGVLCLHHCSRLRTRVTSSDLPVRHRWSELQRRSATRAALRFSYLTPGQKSVHLRDEFCSRRRATVHAPVTSVQAPPAFRGHLPSRLTALRILQGLSAASSYSPERRVLRKSHLFCVKVNDLHSRLSTEIVRCRQWRAECVVSAKPEEAHESCPPNLTSPGGHTSAGSVGSRASASEPRGTPRVSRSAGQARGTPRLGHVGQRSSACATALEPSRLHWIHDDAFIALTRRDTLICGMPIHAHVPTTLAVRGPPDRTRSGATELALQRSDAI